MISNKYKVVGKGIKVLTKRDLVFRKGDLKIPKNTELTVFFNETNPSRIVFEHNGNTCAVKVEKAFDTFVGHGFKKMPSMKALERMTNDGIVTTVTGERVEPDGYGSDGSPSWLLVLGVI